jgi:HSP20 family protein
MNLAKLNPWNWFKHEEGGSPSRTHVPVTREGGKELRSYPGSFLNLHREIDRLFDDAATNFGLSPMKSIQGDSESGAARLMSMYSPKIDVSCEDKHYEIILDVPGLTESDISINVKGDVLTISGQKEEKTENNDKHFYRVERSYGSFQRTLSLPDDASVDDISASLKNGVLTLEIPRQSNETENTRKISISS